MGKKKIIVAGHICLDITPVFLKHDKKDVNGLLQPGKLIQMGEADVHTGGAVANTGLAMKLLGASVSLVGKLGKDAFGDMVMNVLKCYDTGDGMICDKSATTSYSVVIAMPGVDRIFLHHPGANDTFEAADVKPAMLEGVSLFHFGYPPLMEKMYRDNGKELVKLMKTVKEAGVMTSLDMAAVDGSSKAGLADWKAILKEVLPYVDFFEPSVEELMFMLDRERYEMWQERAAGCDITEVLCIEDIKPLADICMEYGCKVLLIKCGAPGIYFRTAKADKLMNAGLDKDINVGEWADKTWFEKSYVPDCILSGTGAGDTSIAAFLTAMLEGYPPKRCMELTTATGASCVTAYDALSGLKPFDELIEKIEKGWKKC